MSFNKDLPLSRRIHNAHGCQEADRLHGIHCYLHGSARSKEEWDNIWSRSDDASWGHEFGRMRGFDAVYQGSVTTFDGFCYRGYLELKDRYPQIGGKDPRPLTCVSMHVCAAGVVAPANDGMSVRSLYLTPSFNHSHLNVEGCPWCKILWERYGSDYVYEDGEWLYIHEQVCPDFSSLFDEGNWASEVFWSKLVPPDHPLSIPNQATPPPPLEEPEKLHFIYSPYQPVQDTCPWPEPYETLDAEHSYAPPREPENIRARGFKLEHIQCM